MAKPSVLDQIVAGTDNLPDPLESAKPKVDLDSIMNGTDTLPDPMQVDRENDLAAKDFTSTIEPPMGTTDPVLLRMAETRGRVLRAGQKCPPGIDCSRYTSTVLKRLGSKVQGSAVQQYHKTERVNLGGLVPGDLVFFDNGKRDTYNTVGKRVGDRFVNHVGIYIGEGKFIQDPGKGSDRRRGEPIDLAQYVRDLKANNSRAAFMGGGRVSDLHQQPTVAPQRPAGTLPPVAPLPGQQPLIQPGLGQQMQEQLVTNPLPGIADSEAALAAKAGQVQPNTTATINSPVGPITITEYPGVGYEADIPGVGKVKGKNYAAVWRNALKQAKINAEQAATVKGHPSEAAYIPSSDVRPPNVNLGQEGTLGSGVNNKHLTDKQKYEGTMAEIDKVGAWMADQLKQMTPEAGLIKLADETGIPISDTARALATAMPNAMGNMAGQFAMSPVRWAAKSMVLGSDEYTTQEKLETAAGLLLEAATTNIGLTGRSAMDGMFEWAAKKFGSPEKFKAALDKLKLEPNQRAMIETGIDTYTGPGTIGPARKAIKGVDNAAEVDKGVVRDIDAAKRNKNAARGKTELQPTTDQDALMARARGEKAPPGAGRRTADQELLRAGKGGAGGGAEPPSPWKWPSTVADTAAKEAGLGGSGGAAPETAGAGGSGAAVGAAGEAAQEAGIRGLHLSNDPSITHLDPERLGTGPNATINDKSAAVKGTWIYPTGAQVERAVANSTKHAYEVNFKPGEIYDLTKDPQGLLASTKAETGLAEQGLMDAINKKLKDQGFKGVSMDQDGQPFRIFSFDKVEATPSIHPGPVGKSKGPLAKSALADLEAGIHNTLNVPVEKEGGGWTFNPKKWFAKHDTPGFSVGGVVKSKIVDPEDLTPQLIKKFADENAELLADPSRRLGLWKNPETGKVSIDVTDILDDEAEAIALGTKRGEDAIGRLGEGGKYIEDIDIPKASTPKSNPSFLESKEYTEAKARWDKGLQSYFKSTGERAAAAGKKVGGKRGGNSGKVEWDRLIGDAAILVKGKVIQSGETVSSVAKAMLKSFPELKASPKTLTAIVNKAEQLLKESGEELPKAKDLPGGVAMANSVTNTVKKLIGEDIYLGTSPQTIEEWAAAAEKAGYTTPEGAHKIAKDILSIVKPWKRSLTPEETIGMATALDGLVAKFDDLSKKYLESATRGGDMAQSEALDLVRQQIVDITNASNQAGAEWARSGMARQAIMKADNSAAGIIARRHKDLERELTEDEIADAIADADALKKVVDEQRVHIASLEREQADRAYRRYLNELRTKGPRSSDQVKEIDAKIKDVGARLKEKWAAAAYGPEDKGGLMMQFSPVSPERLAQLAAIAPEIKELIGLYLDKGFTSAKDHLGQVVKGLKEFTGQDFTEDEVLAVALGKAKQATQKVDRPKTAKELFDAEARSMWNDAAKEHGERVRYITQREREVVKKYQGAQREQELALLRRERENLRLEEQARKEAEKAFYASQKAEKASEALDAKNRAAAAKAQAKISEQASRAADAAEYKAAREAEQFANSAEKQAAREQAAKEAKAAREEMMADAKDAREAEAFYKGTVRDEQKAFNKAQLEKARGERKESMLRWKASVQGDRAAAMNRIERLNAKIDHFDKTGQILGAKSDLPKPLDDTLQKLKLEEAALRNKMAQKEAQAKAQDAYDRMPEWRRTFKKFNPWTLTRSVVASTDNSFLMNQGGMALFSDPKSWGKGAGASFKSITADGYDNVMAKIRADSEWYEKAEASGLFEGNANLQDIFGTDVISKIPGVGNSQTMYEGGSNALRFDMFKAWSSMAEAGGKTLDVADYKAIAKEVKTWTGQGAWGKNVQSLSKPFFALRYRLSQFETALGAPLMRTFKHGMETGNYSPFKVIAAKYAQGYGTMAVTAGLANQALASFGPKDSTGKPILQLDLDPRSTNFGRLVHRVNGRTAMTWDVLPPQLRTIGLMAKIGLGVKVTTSGNELDSSDYKNKDLREAEIGRYATNGLHPVLASMWAYLKGQDSKDKMYFGKSEDFGKLQGWQDLGMSFTPISVQTVKEIWDNKDLSFAEKLIGTVTAPLVNTGVQEQKKSGGKKKTGPSFGGAPKGGGFKKASFPGAP